MYSVDLARVRRRQVCCCIGGLHTEMAVLMVHGNWLEDSGWTSALTEADITTSGRADSLMIGSQVKQMRYTHEVTAYSLHILLDRAYINYIIWNYCCSFFLSQL